MKQRNVLKFLLLSFMIISLTGCASDKKSDNADDSKKQDQTVKNITVTDHDGNTVTVPSKIDRIVVCDIYPMPSVLSVFFDSADKIVGMAEPSMTAAKNSLLSELYPQILNAKTDFIDGTNVNIEELISLDPDVVFYSAGSSELGKQLRGAGLSAVAISASKWEYDAIETLNKWIELLDQIFPDNSKAAIVKEYSNRSYDRVQAKVSSLTDEEKADVMFLFKYDESTIATSGNRFFGQWWADAIGANNVGAEIDKDNAAVVNMEQVYKWNPSIVFITNFNTAQPDDLYNNTIGSNNWSEIDAVKNQSVYKMPLGMYRSYTCGVDTPVTLLWLAKTTYPELFTDIDITAETKLYYKEVFGIDLTDEQADKIFAPVSDAGTGIK